MLNASYVEDPATARIDARLRSLRDGAWVDGMRSSPKPCHGSGLLPESGHDPSLLVAEQVTQECVGVVEELSGKAVDRSRNRHRPETCVVSAQRRVLFAYRPFPGERDSRCCAQLKPGLPRRSMRMVRCSHSPVIAGQDDRYCEANGNRGDEYSYRDNAHNATVGPAPTWRLNGRRSSCSRRSRSPEPCPVCAAF
jgi:hypothetical protein